MDIPPAIIQGLITLVVGGGFVTMLTQGIRGLNSLRGGARASNRAVIRDLVEDRQSAEERLEHKTRVADYWRGVAGNYAFQLRSNGIVPNPEEPIPPKAQVVDDARGRAKVRELEDTLAGLSLDDEDPKSPKRK